MKTQLVANWNISDPAEPAILPNGRPENPRAHAALLDYLRLGPGRSFTALFKQYQDQSAAPTHSQGVLRKWSSHYAWPARAAAFDALENQRLQAENTARRAAILQKGLALEHERIVRLTALYEKLDAIASHEEAFWITDIRFVRQPDASLERVETRRFNGALVRSLRGLLDDLASETGGRPLRLPLRPTPEEPSEPAYKLEDYSLEVLSPDDRAEFIRLQNIIFSNPVRHEK